MQLGLPKAVASFLLKADLAEGMVIPVVVDMIVVKMLR